MAIIFPKIINLKSYFLRLRSGRVLIMGALAVLLTLSAILSFLLFESQKKQRLAEDELSKCVAAASIGVLPPSDAAAIAVEYINRDLLKGKMAASTYEAVEVSGLYEFVITVDGKQYDTYVTKDGKIMFAQAHKIMPPGESQNK